MPGLNASFLSDDTEEVPTSCTYWNYGFQLMHEYDHSRNFTDIVDVAYNARMRKFIVLDTRGITSWSYEKDSFFRELSYSKYATRQLRSLLYCEKYNVYFAICHDFTLQVFNKEFNPTCKAENPNMRSVLHIIYNSKTDELITSGTGGTMVWKYQHSTEGTFNQIKSMANYSLVLSAHHKKIGGSWCTKVVLLKELQQIYFCSENDLFVYTADGLKPIFQIKNAHSSSLTCAACWVANRMLVTGSMDTEVKVWGSTGGHINTFRGHSQPVTSLVVHPDNFGLAMSASLDGTIKVWSLHVMELFWSLNVFSHGIDWMDVTHDGKFWCATDKQILVYKFHSLAEFWGHARCSIDTLQMIYESGKSRKIMAAGEDGSVRMFSPLATNSLAVCTALPPPVVSLSDDKAMSVTYSRFNNLIFILIDPEKIWVYTGKTDPACRLAEWYVPSLLSRDEDCWTDINAHPSPSKRKISFGSRSMHVALSAIPGYTKKCSCTCLSAVYSSCGFVFDGDHGQCSARSRYLLLLGLKDGRILFMDQLVKGLKYFELAISKDPVNKIKVDRHGQRIYTLCAGYSSYIQIWNLPTMQQVYVFKEVPDLSTFSLFTKVFVTGHSNGAVVIKTLEWDAAELQTETISPYVNCSVFDYEDHLNHRSPVIDIQPCVPQKIFASCSCDGTIKIWSFDKTLLTEISLDSSLSCCVFLNWHGDLLVGWKKHIYLIDRDTVSNQLEEKATDDAEFYECASQIYEDPAVRYDANTSNPSAESLTIEKYLTPYNFIVPEQLDQQEVVNRELVKQELEKESSTSNLSVHAPTEIYISPAESVASLFAFEDESKWDFPEFGKSPGPTPSPSVRSEASTDKDIILNLEEVAMDTEARGNMTRSSNQQLATTVAVAKAIARMKPKEATETEEDFQDDEIELEYWDSPIQIPGINDTVGRIASSDGTVKSPIPENVSHVSKLQPLAKSQAKKSKKHISPRKSVSHRVQRTSLDEIPSLPSLEAADTSPASAPNMAKMTFGSKGVEVHPFSRSVSIPHRNPSQKREANLINRPFGKIPLPQARFKGSGRNRISLRRKSGGKFPDQVQPPDLYSSTKRGISIELPPAHLEGHTQNRNYSKAVTQVNVTCRSPKFNAPVSSPREGTDSSAEETNLEDSLTQGDNREDNKSTDKEKLKAQSDKAMSNTRPVRWKRLPRAEGRVPLEYYKEFEHLVKSAYGGSRLESIYKNDGLQFDETWQERMLERYMLMKVERERRQIACATKRAMLLEDRQYKILTQHPELTYSQAYAWYEDHARSADHILSSPLMTGNKEVSGGSITPRHIKGPMLLQGAKRFSDNPLARPSSVADGSNQDIDDDGEGSLGNHLIRKYRFSISEHPEKPADAKDKPRPKSTSFLPPPTEKMKTHSRHPSGHGSPQKLNLPRPRSSASIPGKTRYILVKSDQSLNSKTRTPTPSKLEEDLMRRRFPGQHSAVMRKLQMLYMEDQDDEDEALELHPISQGLQRQPSFSDVESRSSSVSSPRRYSAKDREVKFGAIPSIFAQSSCRQSPISVLHRRTSSYLPTAFKV